MLCCPHCGSSRVRVTGGEHTEGRTSKKRRRKCIACGKNFTTIEFAMINSKLVTDEKVVVILASRVS